MGSPVIIVGGGIAGLSTGCYARMSGYDTKIFEMHDRPGGLCTAWERKGYTVDGCLSWLVGSAPGSKLYEIWQELGALQGREVINMDVFCRAESLDGRVFNLYSDLDRLQAHLNELAPNDRKQTERIVGAARRFERFLARNDPEDTPNTPFQRVASLRRILPYLPALMRWGRRDMKNLATGFADPFLREAWRALWYDDLSAVAILMTMAMLHRKEAGYVIGGSLPFARAIEKRYLDLGGELSYKSRVSRILVEGNRAVGVRLEDGTEERADYVISAADGHATIFDMLEGRYLDKRISRYYEELPLFPPLVYVGLGVKRTFDELPQMISGMAFQLEQPVSIGGKERQWLPVRIHSFDPTLAPPGKTVLTLMLDTEYPYWEALYQDRERYWDEKQQIADTVVSLLDRRFPGLGGQVEMRDVATPMTFVHYTGNWQGSFEGWLPTPRTVRMRMKKTLPGLDRFYMVGQWVQPGGGLPTGAIHGRQVTQMLCKRDGRGFRGAESH
jgi:phytoene dehydrogenase-like protein